MPDLGDLRTRQPQDLQITSAPYDCTPCRCSCTTALSDLAPSQSASTHRVIDMAVRVVVEDGLPYRPARGHVWRDHRVLVPCATIHNGVEAREKKAPSRMGTALLDGALAELSGSVALDEWSDGRVVKKL